MKLLSKITYIFLPAFLFRCAPKINVNQDSATHSYLLPPPQRSAVKISVIHTAYNTSPEAFVFSGGNVFKSHRSEHMALYVKHPKGDFLFDSGLGEKVDEQFKSMSWFERKLFSYKKIKPAFQQLQENNYSADSVKAIVLSHLHWDHASGLRIFLRPGWYLLGRKFLLPEQRRPTVLPS